MNFTRQNRIPCILSEMIKKTKSQNPSLQGAQSSGASSHQGTSASRGVFCNRTLNFRSIKAIGYDMDYTLVDYHAEAFERTVFRFSRDSFLQDGWPVADLEFDPSMVARGLVIDIERGNLVKANRFGYIKQAMHGTRMLDHLEHRELYSRTLVDLSERRWIFLNTLFSLSEGCLYAQLVDKLDQGLLPNGLGYEGLYRQVRSKVDLQHMEGRLKAEILKDPETYVVKDSEAPLALLDQRYSGKKLMLITNSDWDYTQKLMSYAYNPFLPKNMTWRDLFDLIIVSARKPDFFTSNAPFFQVVSEDGLLRPMVGKLQGGQAYVGGCASQVERDLGVSGDQVLYVGDHMFGDVNVSKQILHWRTGLIMRELEHEIEALEAFHDTEARLAEMMHEKESMEARISWLRLELQRIRHQYAPNPTEGDPATQSRMIEGDIQDLRDAITAMDDTLAPMAKAATELLNPRWGLLTRAGNDKSHLARQVERYADVYTSRVSNFLHATPFAFLRSPRGTMPHD